MICGDLLTLLPCNRTTSPPVTAARCRSDFGDNEEVVASAKYEYPSHGYEIQPIDVEDDDE